MNLLVPLLVTIIGVLVSSILTVMGWLGKEKLEHMEGKIDEVDAKVDNLESRSEKKHKTIVEWLARINNNVEGVEPPEEVEERTGIDD